MRLAVIGSRNATTRINGSVSQLFVAVCWEMRARSRENAVKGSNNTNLEPGLSCVNAIREKCPFD